MTGPTSPQRESSDRPYAICYSRLGRWDVYEHTCGGWHWIARFRYQGMAEAYKDKLNDWWERYFKGQTS